MRPRTVLHELALRWTDIYVDIGHNLTARAYLGGGGGPEEARRLARALGITVKQVDRTG